MARYARQEREALADTLVEVGPDAPTLCEGWNTRDLAAHIVVRDRRPDAGPGILIKPLAGWTDRVQRQYRDGNDYPELVRMVRNPPPWSLLSLPPLDELANTVEFFVHTEDVRRAQPGWTARPLDPGLGALLWPRARALARLRLRRLGAPSRLVSPGYGEMTVGTGEPAVHVSGDPGELVLFFFGRRGAADVEITGREDLVARLRGTHRS
jgi:uncharacterized protein (TIGR03085 family)